MPRRARRTPRVSDRLCVPRCQAGFPPHRCARARARHSHPPTSCHAPMSRTGREPFTGGHASGAGRRPEPSSAPLTNAQLSGLAPRRAARTCRRRRRRRTRGPPRARRALAPAAAAAAAAAAVAARRPSRRSSGSSAVCVRLTRLTRAADIPACVPRGRRHTPRRRALGRPAERQRARTPHLQGVPRSARGGALQGRAGQHPDVRLSFVSFASLETRAGRPGCSVVWGAGAPSATGSGCVERTRRTELAPQHAREPAWPACCAVLCRLLCLACSLCA